MAADRMTRRRFAAKVGSTLAAAGLGSRCRAGSGEGGDLRLVSREVFVPRRNGTGVFPGFVTYIHSTKPVLLHRFGWVDASDTYDNFHESISRDNGKTWSEPVLKLQSRPVEGGRIRYEHHPKSGSAIYEVRMVLGTPQSDGTVSWRTGSPLVADNNLTTRGFSESSPIELRDGRLALLSRGSNAGVAELAGYKWLSFSEDGGDTWSPPKPLACADGRAIDSSATGCSVFRSIKMGKAYFIGNLCRQGERDAKDWKRAD